MGYTNAELKQIYDQTSGYCHLCKKKLALTNYDQFEAKGAWEVDHLVPRSKGGSDHISNLRAACISCNRSKGAGSTRSARAKNGVSRAPLSRKKRRQAKLENTLGGVAVGTIAGGFLGGPFGAALGAGIGAMLTSGYDPDKG